MIALDTNVIVRVVTGDDPEQLAAALAVMSAPELYISKTVILETAWVLSFTYRLDRSAVGRALTAVVGYPNVTVEGRIAVLQALTWHANGLDFADALHLASARDAVAFATFDRKLATPAANQSASPVVRLLGGDSAAGDA